MKDHILSRQTAKKLSPYLALNKQAVGLGSPFGKDLRAASRS